ncbi:MAG TPA: acyl-CoA dehydrogenase family protein [Acidimicrobiales bacterium]|nr:acyl-CoA dehydrogenase family protein [Acidimicrobiales bacterium]
MPAVVEDQIQTDTDEQRAFRAEVREFLAANARPKQAVSPWALNFHTSEEDARAEFENGRRWQRRLYDAGFAGLTYPPEYGGRGGQPWHEQIFREEVAEFDVSVGFISSTIAMLGPTIMRHGTEQQRRELLPRLLSGDDAWCQLFSEPGAGSDLAGLGCRAVRDGDEFVVTGQKVWNSAAQFCDHGMLLVRTNTDAPKHRGITFLLVDMRSPGIEVRPLVQATGAAHFNEVFLSEVRVPIANVLGDIDGGWAAARTVLSNESAFIGGGGGSVNAKLRMLARDFDVASDPIIRQDLARHYTRERLLGLMSERILAAVRKRETPPIDPSILKLYVAQNRVLSGNLAIAIAGPAGVVATDQRSRWIQGELVGRYGISIGGGTNEVQRNNLAERALGLPREPRVDQDLAWRDIPRG